MPTPRDFAAWQQVQAWQQQTAAAEDESARKFANWALACGVLGLFVFGIVLGPLAFVLGLAAHSRLRPGQRGKGEATTAMVLGGLGFLGFFFLLAMF